MKRLWMTKSLPHVKQICLPSVISNVINNKNGVGKFVRLTNEKKKRKEKKNRGHNITICFNFHVSPSLPPFVFAVFFIPYFNVLRSYFCLTQFACSSRSFNFDQLPAWRSFLKFSLVLTVLRIAGRWSSGTSSNGFFFHLPGPNVRLVISLFYNPWRVRVETSYWGFVNFRMRVKLTKISLVRNIQISSAQIALKSKRLSLHTQYSGAWAKTTTMAVKTSLKNMNLPPFKLYRAYLHPLNLSNVGDSSWSWILKDFVLAQKETGKFVVVCSRPS